MQTQKLARRLTTRVQGMLPEKAKLLPKACQKALGVFLQVMEGAPQYLVFRDMDSHQVNKINAIKYLREFSSLPEFGGEGGLHGGLGLKEAKDLMDKAETMEGWLVELRIPENFPQKLRSCGYRVVKA